MKLGKARTIIVSTVVLGLFFTCLMAGTLNWYKKIIYQSGPHRSDVLVFVERGSSHKELKSVLAQAGVLNESYHFDVARLVTGDTFVPKAGEYLLPSRASLNQVISIIHQGYSYQRKLTIIEGLRSSDIINILKDTPHLVGKLDKVPDEGSLSPDTYFYTRGTERKEFVRRLQQRRDIALAEAWANRDIGLPYKTPLEALILASIIEKEASTAPQRKLVAAVLVNRLKKSMRLQSDPTVTYEKTATPERPPVITKTDLNKKTPWNTYVIDGLPPTPICNPGIESLLAAVKPPKSDFLYFVSDGFGGLRFAKTLDEHNRNVRLFRRTQSKLIGKL